MEKILKNKKILWDVICVGIITVVSLFIISFYLNANYINTRYEDWMVHAYRVKSLQEFGYSSWTHVWSNGINIWKGYQFLPHVLTWLVVTVTHLEIPRAMVLITVSQFILLRLFMYGTLRLLKFSPIVSFMCAMLSLNIAQYWSGVNDYSILFGFTVFPLIIFAWIKYGQGKIEHMFPFITGFLFYLHPVTAFYTALLWITGIIFSDKKLFSKSLILQYLIFFVTSSLFWFPIIFKSSYSYSSPELATRYFLNLVLSHYQYYGLSLSLIICFLIAGIRSLLPIKPELRWSRSLYLFILMIATLIVAGISIDLPKFITQFQFARGVTMLGIAILFVIAGVLEEVIKVKSMALKGIITFIVCIALIEGIWFASDYSPVPAQKFEDPVVQFSKQRENIQNARVWSPKLGNSSYFTNPDIRFPYSYQSHMESNQIANRLTQLILYHPYVEEAPKVAIDRLTDYFKLSGTEYAFFEEASPFTKTLSASSSAEYKNLGRYTVENSLYHAFKMPWQPRNAVLIQKQYREKLSHFPFNLKFNETNDQTALDDYIHQLANTIYKDDNLTLKIEYPTNETITVTIPDNRSTNLVYINESHDNEWVAKFNGRKQVIEPAGPNYMLVKLDNENESGTLLLKHAWPVSFYLLVSVIAAIPVSSMAWNFYKTNFNKKRKDK